MASEHGLFGAFEAFEGLEALEVLSSPTAIVGLGAVVLAPIVLPIVTEVAKPLAKAMIKEGLVMYSKAQDAIAEANDTWGDWVAEAKSELAAERANQANNSVQLRTIAVEDD